MCGPAALVVASTALSVVGTGVAALQANAQAKYQAKIAERNASLEREAGLQEEQQTQDDRRAHYRRLSQLKGEQRAIAAANGVSVEFGTASDIMADTDMLGREDIQRINQAGFNRRRSRDISASNYVAEAQASRQAGKGALINGLFSAGSTALSGATQYSKIKAGR